MLVTSSDLGTILIVIERQPLFSHRLYLHICIEVLDNSIKEMNSMLVSHAIA
jgi:hypothetical protein